MNQTGLFCGIVVSSLLFISALNAQRIATAADLYYQFDIKAAYQAYEQVSKTPADDWEQAQLKLARIDWLLFEDEQKATARLEELVEKSRAADQALTVWARMLLDQQKYGDAIARARQAEGLATSLTSKYDAQLIFLEAVLERCIDGISSSNDLPPLPHAELEEAYTRTLRLMQDYPGDIALSHLALGFALVKKDKALCLNAWGSFFRMTDAEPSPFLQEAYQSLESGVAQWNTGSEDSSGTLNTVRGLARSGFYQYTALLLLQDTSKTLAQDPYVISLRSYIDFLKRIKHLTHRFYLDTVQEKQDEAGYKSALIMEAENLWNELKWNEKFGNFDVAVFQKQMETTYGAVFLSGTINGFYGLHYGHLIQDEAREVTQYGQGGKLRFLVIDHMLSNGYSSWFWDGEAEVGGWAPGNGSILQVRSAYSKDPVKAWLLMTDPVKITEQNNKQLFYDQQDDSLASIKKITFLPGLAKRIEKKAYLQIMDALKKAGVDSAAMRLAFIELFEEQAMESGIFAHEGRHAIDLITHPKIKSKTLEYRAKLSEIYFAPNPFLALYNIFSRNINDRTSHGQANYRVIKGIVNWMKKNKSSIAGLDVNRPLLCQIDQLSDQQLKMAVWELDPLRFQQ